MKLSELGKCGRKVEAQQRLTAAIAISKIAHEHNRVEVSDISKLADMPTEQLLRLIEQIETELSYSTQDTGSGNGGTKEAHRVGHLPVATDHSGEAQNPDILPRRRPAAAGTVRQTPPVLRRRPDLPQPPISSREPD